MSCTKTLRYFFNTNHFLSFPFCGPKTKPHGVKELSKNYHIQSSPKLGHGI